MNREEKFRIIYKLFKNSELLMIDVIPNLDDLIMEVIDKNDVSPLDDAIYDYYSKNKLFEDNEYKEAAKFLMKYDASFEYSLAYAMGRNYNIDELNSVILSNLFYRGEALFEWMDIRKYIIEEILES
jgi:hypothetical protein